MKLFCLGAAFCAMLSAGTVAAVPDAPRVEAAGDLESFRERYSWLGEIDDQRAFSDQAYADEMLARLDTLPTLIAVSAEARLLADSVRSLRLILLLGAQRIDDAATLITGLTKAGDAAPLSRNMGVVVYAGAGRVGEAIALVEDTSATLRGPDLATFIDGLDREMINALFQWTWSEKRVTERERLTIALARMGWPGGGDRASADDLRTSAASIRLKAGALDEAKQLASAISTPSSLAEMLSQRSMDAVARDGDPMQRIAAAMEAEDQAGAQGVQADPLNLTQVRNRVQFLRSAGRSEQAYDLAQPYVGDMESVRGFVAEGMADDIFWLVNETAYALSDLGRGGEAVALLTALESLDVEQHGQLISMMINKLGILRANGQHAEAAAAAVDLAENRSALAAPYGLMWMWSNAVCAYRELGRPDAAAPWAAKVAAQSNDNESAHIQAMLCTGDQAGAEALMIQRLQSDDPTGAIMALQDYRRGPQDRSPLELAAFAKLKADPAVRAAFDKVAHRLALPMHQTYWGNY